MAMPSVMVQHRYAVAGTEWVTGASDGSLAMWSQTKKRPTSVLRKAHGYPRPGLAPFNAQPAGSLGEALPTADGMDGLREGEPLGPGSVGGDAASWIGAVGVCKGTDLVVSHAAGVSVFASCCLAQHN